MARPGSKSSRNSISTLDFKEKLWLAADKLRNEMGTLDSCSAIRNSRSRANPPFNRAMRERLRWCPEFDLSSRVHSGGRLRPHYFTVRQRETTGREPAARPKGRTTSSLVSHDLAKGLCPGKLETIGESIDPKVERSQ